MICHIVDDDELFAEELAEALSARGYDCRAFHEPSRFISSLFATHAPQIVITDINIPDISGWGLLEIINNLRSEDRLIETIVISGENSVENVRRAIQFDCSDYIVKPIDIDELTQALEKSRLKLKEKSTSLVVHDADRPLDQTDLSCRLWMDFYQTVDRLFPEACRTDGHLRVLLYLKMEQHRTGYTGVTSAAYASGMPFSTGLRRVNDLVEAGLVARVVDHVDSRRQLLNLTDEGEELLSHIGGIDLRKFIVATAGTP